jgi:molybdopterin-guanine dinucleotide biosynthesis protein A
VHDVVVLAGGSGRRLGGVDKPALEVGGRTLLDRVLDACDTAASIVVVGPERTTSRRVTWTREQPPGGGPLAGLAAGLAHVTAPVTLLLAADLPFFTPECAAALVVAAPAVLMGEGREQWLCSAWPTHLLVAALEGVTVEGGRLGAFLDSLGPVRLAWSGPGEPWADIDTAEDLARTRSEE